MNSDLMLDIVADWVLGSVTVVNKYHGVSGIPIGRPSIVGNPYSHQTSTSARYSVATREEAVEKYASWLDNHPGAAKARRRVEEWAWRVVGGSHLTLQCCCAPKPCHGDILKARVEAMAREILEQVHSCPAMIEVIDREDKVHVVKGTYWGDGRIEAEYKGVPIGIDPDFFHPDDAKRFFRADTNKWTRLRVRSVILDSKAIKREAAKAR